MFPLFSRPMAVALLATFPRCQRSAITVGAVVLAHGGSLTDDDTAAVLAASPALRPLADTDGDGWIIAGSLMRTMADYLLNG